MFPPVSRMFFACLLSIGMTVPFPAVAEETAIPPTEMETVTVTGTAEDLLSGTSTLSGTTLRQLPLKNGGITEAITVLPHVQAGEAQRTSEQAGEILPPLISISGARPYENYFSIDGIGLGSLLDPLADNIFKSDGVPGHPQRLFVHRDLVDSVTVYDSNVPARFGGFLGGVVDAKTRNPATTPGGSVNYRTTRDDWARQHIDDEREDDFDNSRYFDQQPRYEKHDTGAQFDLPLNETMGLLAAYQTVRSKLELDHLGEEHNKDKTLDNYFLKYAWIPDDAHSLEITGMYTPSEEDFFYENTKNSDLTIKRGGYSLSGNYAARLASGDLTVSAAYLENENSRRAPNYYYSWLRTASKNWGTQAGTSRSLEGGFGDIDSTEESLQFKIDYALDPVRLGWLTHAVSFGIAYTRDEGTFDRQETLHIYNTSAANPTACLEGDPTCVVGEQYFNRRNVYVQGESSAVVHRQGYYFEDLASFGRFTLRPGVRVSHDDFLGNTDVAHRLAGSWDILGSGATRLLAGHNRYYGEALLTYKLREAIEPYVRQKRDNPLADWVLDTNQTTTLTRFSELDTPYSDEFTVQLVQQLFSGDLTLGYLDRRHRDQFARGKITEDGKSYYVLNNYGSSNYEAWSIGWERQWLKHYLNINYTYTEAESTNETYDMSLEDVDIDERIWYDGDYVTREDLPRTDYYRPHVVNVVYVGKLPWGLTFTNVTKYQSGYEGLDFLNNAEKTARGIPTSDEAYLEEKRSGSCIFDWRLDWETRTWREQLLTLSLEVNNVFDRQVKVGGDSDDIYELGREFWLGMTYKF